MKRYFVLLITLFITCALLAQTYTLSHHQISDKLSLRFNKNVEFLGFCYFLLYESQNIESKKLLIDNQVIPKKEWHTYGYRFYKKYQQYSNNKHAQKALSIAHHLWLDYLLNLLLQVDDFPNAILSPSIHQNAYIRFSKSKNPEEAREMASSFLSEMNQFYNAVNFERYLTENEIYYSTTLQEIRSILTQEKFIERMEVFYKHEFQSYSLVPSLTIPKGMGFGLRHSKDDIFNVFGAFTQQSLQQDTPLQMGFQDTVQLREFSIHEFGHSFVNTIIPKPSKAYIDSTRSLMEPIDSAMRSQGYEDWPAVLDEHIVRASEIMISRQSATNEETERLTNEYLNTRKFIYIPRILRFLEYAANNPDYSFQSAILDALQSLKGYINSSPIEKKRFHLDPDQVNLHTEDIDLFWQLFDQTQPKFNANVWQTSYLDSGSIGLKAFVRGRIGSGRKLAKTIKKNRPYYEQVRTATNNVAKNKEQFYAAFRRLKAIYPHAVFPDVYFVIGSRNTGGAIFRNGIIIGTERFGYTTNGFTPDIEFENLTTVIVHELVHFQQRYKKDNSLLAQSLREGVADFIAELVTGNINKKEMYKYGEEHEKELWEEFYDRKEDKDWSNWLYASRNESRPRNLGYWMGYKIAQSYYQNHENKSSAINELLNIKDFNEILRKSNYQHVH